MYVCYERMGRIQGNMRMRLSVYQVRSRCTEIPIHACIIIEIDLRYFLLHTYITHLNIYYDHCYCLRLSPV